MFQSFKRRTVGLSAARQQPINAEFDTHRNHLQNVAKSLTTALSEIDQAEAQWKELIKSNEHFSSSLHSLYPIEDDVRALFKSTLDSVQGVFPKEIADASSPTSQVRGIERMVKAYLTEIKTLSAEYPKVDHARRDYAMDQGKLEKLGKKEGGSNDKQTKALDKVEASKAQYTSILDGTVHRMKTTYEKAPTMFRAAYVAYWLYQNKVMTIIDKHLGHSQTYAKAHAESLFKMSESSHH